MFNIAISKAVATYDHGVAFIAMTRSQLERVFDVQVVDEGVEKGIAKGVYKASSEKVEAAEAFFELVKISGQSIEALLDHSTKKPEVSQARAIIAYTLHDRYGLSVVKIANLMGYKAHAGVLYLLLHFEAGRKVGATDLEHYYRLVKRRFKRGKAWKERADRLKGSSKDRRRGNGKSTPVEDTEAKAVTE